MEKLPLHRISLALFALFFSHVATATLLHHKTKISQRYAPPALTNIEERGLNNVFDVMADKNSRTRQKFQRLDFVIWKTMRNFVALKSTQKQQTKK